MPGRKQKGGIYAVKMAKKVGRVKPIVPLSRRRGAMTFFTAAQAAGFDTEAPRVNARRKS